MTSTCSGSPKAEPMASLAPESQASAVVDALLDAPATAALTAHLDDVLAWLAQGPAAEGAIGRELEGRSLDPRHVRSLALGRLDEFLFVDGRGPLRALGLPSDASRDRVKLRYRLLMRVYHPDRMGDSAEMLGEILKAFPFGTVLSAEGLPRRLTNTQELLQGLSWIPTDGSDRGFYDLLLSRSERLAGFS